jgi:hypothetical protein
MHYRGQRPRRSVGLYSQKSIWIIVLKKIVFTTTLLFASAVFAGSAHTGDTVELHGRLVLRGNEPFVYPVVFDDTGGVWALEGISRPDAAKLQNHIVRVTATVTSEDASRPAVQVQSISVDDSR